MSDYISYNELSKNLKKSLDMNINRGTGAGGKNTNKNGLNYEEITDLNNKITIKENYFKNCSKIVFNCNQNKIFISTKQGGFLKFMKKYKNINIESGHGCKYPDECYIQLEEKTIFIIEKKFQQTSGSVCEKIQTPDFKLWQYQRLFPDFKIIYIYCLSDWFKENCKAELEYLRHKNIPYFWGSSKTYKDEIIHYILNYKILDFVFSPEKLYVASKIKIGQRGIHKFMNRLVFAQGTSEAVNTLRELALRIENNNK